MHFIVDGEINCLSAADSCAVAGVASAAAAASASKTDIVPEGFSISLPHRRVHAGRHCAVKSSINFTFHFFALHRIAKRLQAVRETDGEINLCRGSTSIDRAM